MRPMLLEFPDDPAVAYLDRQYMLGDRLLVAPVFSATARSSSICPRARGRTLTGEAVGGPRWCARRTGSTRCRCYVRPGAVIPVARCDDRPDYDFAEGVELRCTLRPTVRRRPSSCRTPTGEWPPRSSSACRDGQIESRVIEGVCERYTVKLSSTTDSAEKTA